MADDSISVPGPVPNDLSDRIAIVDTNVVVAGLITASSTSPVARIVDGMSEASFAFAVSEPLVAEYRNVLARPSLMRLHGRSPHEPLLSADGMRGRVVSAASWTD